MTQTTHFSSLLVTNRGEIACRIMRTAKAMGLKTIAVYSEADAQAPHVKLADQAYLLGPAPVSESYLNTDRLMAAIKQSGAQAIHPGYGFLSENADFAKLCQEAGLVFIGPSPEAIELMGDKAKAKRRMIEAQVPCVPGYQGTDQSTDMLMREAQKIGFPIMVKAAAGGGGRGMRLVEDLEALPRALQSARSEAENAFGAGALILEKAILQPRHVEIQVFADQHGNVIHLGERDCSVQRRHQKVLEEAPSPAMTPALRDAMGAAAVTAARDINYVGAGTVEFLLDTAGEFYFLEMNTRLQVEHPVTEMVTGLDLVALQIRVARGDRLGVSQEEISLNGHAIEARLYAEDPAANFLPATGHIDLWRPALGDGIRVDSGIETGGDVSPFYDPMLAKIIAHGTSRDDARRKLISALTQTALLGVKTNKRFLIDALSHERFAEGQATTDFIGACFSEEDLATRALSFRVAAVAATLQYELARDKSFDASIGLPTALLNWASASKISTPYRYEHDTQIISLDVTPQDDGTYLAQNEDETLTLRPLLRSAHMAHFEVGDEKLQIVYTQPASPRTDDTIQICVAGDDYTLTNLNAVIKGAEEGAGAGAVLSPMHGALLEVFVAQGQSVTKGARLAVLEAMKMQHEILAEVDGIITNVHYEAGQQVAADSLLMDIDPA